MFHKYLGNAVFNSFLSFFIPLFGIASLIFFIKLVSVTAIIQITFLELLKMYIFILPQILFFILPITFFAAGVLALHRLSFEYETIALFSLGVSPYRFVRSLLTLAALFSLFALLFSLILVPQAKQIYKGFILYKKSEAKLNIRPSEFGHKFGDWYLYLGSKEGQNYTNVALYNNKLQNQENFIVAQKGRLLNDADGLKLLLLHGNAYTYENEKLKEVRFEKMEIFDSASRRAFHYTDPVEYWFKSLNSKKRAFDLTLFLLISFFPVVSIFFIPAIAIHNPRFAHLNPFFLSLFLLALYFGISFALAKAYPFWALIFLPLWFVMGWIYFDRKIARRF
ncbi:MAG: LptF/LptG family permease [Epsilonproteobacteria bacterium]|nr:LptF/LptG family permease [Campylobacterota bacterium]